MASSPPKSTPWVLSRCKSLNNYYYVAQAEGFPMTKWGSSGQHQCPALVWFNPSRPLVAPTTLPPTGTDSLLCSVWSQCNWHGPSLFPIRSPPSDFHRVIIWSTTRNCPGSKQRTTLCSPLLIPSPFPVVYIILLQCIGNWPVGGREREANGSARGQNTGTDTCPAWQSKWWS